MAILGFILCILVGCVLAFYAVGTALLGIGFQSKEGWICLLPGSLAFGMFYFAFTNAPFTISFIAS